jgi:predicted glycoside hydrolase/deacetylase ChbG (UPF0249 family)
MTLSPRWSGDAPALRELRGLIDVGLHLDWTSEFAQQAGHGGSLGAVMWQSLRGALQARAVRDVIERQLDAFELHWQAAPDHVDGHQHVQQFAGVREVLVDVLQQRYGAQSHRPWLRVSKVAQSDLKSRIITWMGASALLQWAEQHAWPVAAPLLGAYGFDGDTAGYATRMQQWMKNLPMASAQKQTSPHTLTPPHGMMWANSPIPVIMCHPALQAQDDDAIGAAREREYAYLNSPEFVWHCQQWGVQLCRGPHLTSTETA